MSNIYHYLIPAIWIVWVIYWRIAARDVKPSARTETLGSRIAHSLPLYVGFFMVTWPDRGSGIFFARCWPRTELTFWIGVLVLVGGCSFSVWARRILGRNWSNEVTVKENHELIQSGPYARIRHPIYTGILLVVLGTAIALSEWRGFVALALILFSFSLKLRIEERWMAEIFGSTYAAYRQRSGALFPKFG